MEVVFNFGGFYNSFYDQEIDSVVYDEDSTIDVDAIDFKALHIEVSKRIVEQFNQYIDNEFDVKSEFKFNDLESPKYYNFSTDTIILDISDLDRIKLDLLVASNEDVQSILKGIVKDVTTSKSGYVAFYDYDKVIAKIDEDNKLVYYQCVLDALMNYDKDEYHNVTLDNLSETISNSI